MLAARRRTIVLLDFLAPSLPRRTFIKVAQNRNALSTVTRKVDKSTIDNPELPSIPLSVPLATRSQAEEFNNSIQHIRRGIQSGNLTHVLERWKALQDKGLLHFLAHPDLQDVTAFVAELFSPENAIPSQLEVQAQDLAVYAAVIHSHDALNACLLRYLDTGDYHTVINIHRRFVEANRKFGDVKNETSVEGSDELTSKQFADEETKPLLPPTDVLATGLQFREATSPGEATTLLAVTAAYAKLDRLHDAFQTCKEYNVPFTDVRIFVRRFEAPFAAELTSFIGRIKIAFIVSNPIQLSRKIKSLSRTPASAPQLLSFYNDVLGALEGPDAFLSIRPDTPPHCLTSIDEVIWTCFLVGFIKTKQGRMAAQIWKDIDRLGVQPGVHTFTAWIDACDSLRDIEGAIAAWKMMHSRGIAPDNLVFRAIIAALYWAKRKDAAETAFDAYRATIGQRLSDKDKLIVYNTALSGMLAVYRVDHALNLLTSMEAQGPFPDIITYNIFLSFYGRKADFHSLASMVDRMAAQKITGDVQSYSTILSALLKIGREDAADMVFSIMKKQGVQPNVVTYTSILQHQLAEKSEGNLRAALRLLRQMESDPGLHPTEKTYATVLKGIRWLPRERVVQLRDDILSRVKRRFVRISEATYNTLISTSLEDPACLEDALVYYQHMKRAGTAPTWRTFFILLTGLRRYEQWEIADEIIGDLYLTGMRAGKPLVEVMTSIKRRNRASWE